METWVLLLVVTSQTAPSVAIIPGYASEQECSRTGIAMHSKTGGRIVGDGPESAMKVQWLCLPGPSLEAGTAKK